MKFTAIGCWMLGKLMANRRHPIDRGFAYGFGDANQEMILQLGIEPFKLQAADNLFFQ